MDSRILAVVRLCRTRGLGRFRSRWGRRLTNRRVLPSVVLGGICRLCRFGRLSWCGFVNRGGLVFIALGRVCGPRLRLAFSGCRIGLHQVGLAAVRFRSWAGTMTACRLRVVSALREVKRFFNLFFRQFPVSEGRCVNRGGDFSDIRFACCSDKTLDLSRSCLRVEAGSFQFRDSSLCCNYSIEYRYLRRQNRAKYLTQPRHRTQQR